MRKYSAVFFKHFPKNKVIWRTLYNPIVNMYVLEERKRDDSEGNKAMGKEEELGNGEYILRSKKNGPKNIQEIVIITFMP